MYRPTARALAALELLQAHARLTSTPTGWSTAGVSGTPRGTAFSVRGGACCASTAWTRRVVSCKRAVEALVVFPATDSTYQNDSVSCASRPNATSFAPRRRSTARYLFQALGVQ